MTASHPSLTGASQVETEFLDLLKDAKIGKRKHFQAAQRKQSWHGRLGFGAVVLATGAGIASAVSLDLEGVGVRILAMLLAFAAAVLIGFQTLLRLEKLIEGHRSIANGYLELHRDGKADFARFRDGRMSIEELDALFAEYRAAYHKLNRESEAFATSGRDLDRSRDDAMFSTQV